MTNHILSLKGVKLVIVSFQYPEGIAMFEQYVIPKLKLKEYGKVYGVDWVILWMDLRT